MTDDLTYQEHLEEERHHERNVLADERGWSALRAADVVPSRVSFAFEGRVPLGSVTGLIGEPGMAKTTLAIELLARASRGQLHGDLVGPCASLYLTAEDSPEHTLVPRLIAAGADLALVSFFNVRRDGIDYVMTLPDDLERLRAAIKETGAMAVVMDPLMALMSGAVDSHRDHDVRRVLAPLARLADDLGIAILVITHTNKSDAPDVFRRSGGSIGLTAAVRSILFLAHDPEAPDDPAARVLLHAKSNLAPMQPTLKLRVESREVSTETETFTTGAIAWCGESAVTADDVFGRREERRSPARDAATAFLDEVLGDRVVPVSEIRFAAKRRDISWRSVERAKSDLGVIAEQIRDPSGQRVTGWCWRLPSTPPPSPPPPRERLNGGLENGQESLVGQGVNGTDPVEDLYTATSPRVEGVVADYDPDDPRRFTR